MSNDPGDKPPAQSPYAPPAGPGDEEPATAPSPTPSPSPSPSEAVPSQAAPAPGPGVAHHAPLTYQPAQFPPPEGGTVAPYNPHGPPGGSPPPGAAPPGPEAGYAPPDAQHPYGAVPPHAYWPQPGYAPPLQPPFPGVLWFLLLVVIGLLIQIVVSVGGLTVIVSLQRADGSPENLQAAMKNVPAIALMAMLLIASLSWPAVALVTAKLKRMLTRDTFRLRWPGFTVSALSALLGLALVPLAQLLENLVARVVPRSDNFIMDIMAKDPSVLALVLLGLTIVPSAAIGEELLFRGLGYRGIERRYGLGLSALAVSFIFAAVHMNATGFLALFMVSMCLCWVTTKSDSLIPPILLHAAYNGIQFVMLLGSKVTPEMAKKASQSTELGIPLWMIPVGLLVSLGCLYAIGKLSLSPDEADEAPAVD